MKKPRFGTGRLIRTGLVVLGCGLILLVAVSVMNRRTSWLPLEVDLPLLAGESVRFEFTPQRDGYYGLQIEADATIGEADMLRYLTDWEGTTELDIDWAVMRGDEVVAAGDATDYVFIDLGPPSRLGRLRRVLLRIPYCQNRLQWLTLGLAGSTTSARGIGRFEAVAGTGYTIRITPAAAYPALTNGGVKLVVRPDRRLWQTHFASTSVLSYTALLALGVGCGLVFLGEFRRRFGVRKCP